jgi:hypothetical protein
MTSATGRIATKSILNPILFLCAIALPSAWGAAIFSEPPLNYLLFVAGCVPLVVSIWAYIHFAQKDPNRLQSEEFLIQQQALSLFGNTDPSHPVELVVDMTGTQLQNPKLKDQG